MLLRDDSVNVVKKAVLSLTQLYRVTLQVPAAGGPGSPPHRRGPRDPPRVLLTRCVFAVVGPL